MQKPKSPLPLFDAIAFVKDKLLPATFTLAFADYDFKIVREFLLQYSGNQATFNAYRREVERLLQWAWLIKEKSILTIKRANLEEYLHFCQKPPLSWIGLKKEPRFMLKEGIRIPNPRWKPFVVTLPKINIKKGEKPNKKHYALSDKSFKEIFIVLNGLYTFLIQENITEVNPVLQIKQKSKYLRRRQGKSKIRRLSTQQWQYVLETAADLAQQNPDEHERTLFMLSALYGMYLRISELTASPRWTPKMGDFFKDHAGRWWFKTVGKGTEELPSERW